MRTVGQRRERPIGLHASGTLLTEGARFNDEMHRLPTGNTTFIPKGVYRFKTHEDANQHQLDCLAKGESGAKVKAALMVLPDQAAIGASPIYLAAMGNYSQ